MATIHTKIVKASTAFESNTGKKAKHVYLGRKEINELIKWAELNGYIHEYVDTDKTGRYNIEGDSRPEVDGKHVYKVNADHHLVCA